MITTISLVIVAVTAAVFGLSDLVSCLDHRRVSDFSMRIKQILGRARKEGRNPTTGEYRRLWLVAALSLFLVGSVLFGPLVGGVAALAGPGVVALVLRSRSRRYQEEIHGGAGVVARSLADALAGGHSVRGAIIEITPTLTGAAGNEVRLTAQQLALGEATELALEQLRRRANSTAWNTLIAAILVAQNTGGNLVALLRDLASAFEATERVSRDARAATAQARFSAWVVLALPVAAAGLAELIGPGFLVSLFVSPISVLFVCAALVLQALAWLGVRRITKQTGAA